MIFDLSKDLDKAQFKARCDFLYQAGKKVKLVEVKAIRSLRSNNYLHLIIGLYALETGYTREEVKQDIYKRKINRDIFIRHKNGVEVCRSSANIDEGEMAISIEKFRNHALNDLGIYLPSPNEDVLLRQVEYELSRYGNQQYL